jgi:hypothetical protein
MRKNFTVPEILPLTPQIKEKPLLLQFTIFLIRDWIFLVLSEERPSKP